VTERDERTRIGTGYIFYRIGPGFGVWGIGALAREGDDEYKAHLARFRPHLEYAGFSFVEAVPASRRTSEPPTP
jgi:hypothetical protein